MFRLVYPFSKNFRILCLGGVVTYWQFEVGSFVKIKKLPWSAFFYFSPDKFDGNIFVVRVLFFFSPFYGNLKIINLRYVKIPSQKKPVEYLFEKNSQNHSALIQNLCWKIHKNNTKMKKYIGI